MHKIAAGMAFRALGVVGVLLAPAAALAQATINVPRDQPTIQAGIDAASDGDTVLVAPGRYAENIDFMGKAITVTSSGGAATTIIDGGATGPVVTFGTSETRASVLSGMTIQNGGGYGVNTGAMGIAGVVVSNTSPTILNNTITQNECWDIEVLYGAPLIEGNTISSTQSPTGGCGGGGSGAGIYIGGNLNADLNASEGSAAIIRGNTIENITIPATDGPAQGMPNLIDSNGGAAIAIFGGGPLIESNILRNNSATDGNGGAINIAAGYGGTIGQNLIYGNSAGCGGGAIAVQDETGRQPDTGRAVIIANNTIVDNSGGQSDFFESCGDAAQIYGTNFGLSSQDVTIVNNIIANTEATVPAVACSEVSTTPDQELESVFDHNLLYNGGAPFFSKSCTDVTARQGNFSGPPQFVDAGAGDYHLMAGSPGIDIGNDSALGLVAAQSGTTLATDFDGNPRVQDATGTGDPVIDMGAYEFTGAVDGSPTTALFGSSTLVGTSGDPLTLTGSFASSLGVPTGSATFFLDDQKMGVAPLDADGVSTFQTVVPAAGVHVLYVAYAGQGSFTPAESVVFIFPVNGSASSTLYATTLQFGANINPQMYGKDVSFSVQTSSADPNPAFVPSPITLTLANGSVIASLTPNREGDAIYSTATLPVGRDIVTATYSGDATHQAATASYTENITGIPTSISMACSPLNIVIGQTSLLTATVGAASGTPTGPVIFRDGGVELGEVLLVNGMANWNFVGQATGVHYVEAQYKPSGAYAGAGSAECEVPTPPPYLPSGVVVTGLSSTSVLSVAPTTGPFQTSTALTATVSPSTPPGMGAPTGSVEFLNGSTAIGMADLVGGVATLVTNSLPAGTDPITCAYGGDSIYSASNCNTVPVIRSVAQAVLTLTASANDIPALTPVTFSVKLSATGQSNSMRLFVVVSVANQAYPVTLDANGSGSVVVSTLLPGSYTVTASFAGNANLLSASSSLTETVVQGASATTLAASPNPGYAGLPVTLTAMVTAADTLVPEGSTVTFYDGTTVLGTGVLDQTRSAKFTTSMLSVGTHALTASYPGTSIFLGSTSAVFDEAIIASSFAIAVSPSTITVPVDQEATVAVQLSSIGSFAGPLTLSYGTLPTNATATLLPATVTLTAGGDGSATLVLNTYTRTTVAEDRGGRRRIGGLSVFVASMLALFPARRRRGRRHGTRLFLWLTLLACVLQAATGCGNSFYTLPGVAAGSYQIPVTATDVNQRTQTAVLTLNVTPQ